MSIINDEIRLVYFNDNRGYFLETFRHSWFPEYSFIQDNESISYYGVLRGLHFQKPPYQQAKYVRVSYGKILDVVVDLRKESPTYKQYQTFILSHENKKAIIVPRGFAHGFVALGELNIVQYKVDNYYAKKYESGIRFDDPDLDIDWQIDLDDLVISQKDMCLPFLNSFKD